MRILTKAECQQWCEEHGFGLSSSGKPSILGAPEGADFRIPKDAGARLALAQGHLRKFREAPEVLVWITEWAVWPSGERMHMFDRFRLSYGVASPLIEHPGHLLGHDEFEETSSMAAFAILFLWDCYVLACDKRAALFYSHDEFGSVSAGEVEQDASGNAGK